jgi:integrase
MAGRKPSVRYWSSRGTWTDEQGQAHKGAYCCEFRGKQHTLAAGPDDSPQGPTYLAALAAYRDLLSLEGAGQAGDRNTFRTLGEFYLRFVFERHGNRTLRFRQQALREFAKTEMAAWPVNQLTPHAVRQWLLAMRQPRTVTFTNRGQTCTRVVKWGDSQVNAVVTTLHAVLNFGVRERLISSNPLRGLSGPPVRTRGRDCVLLPEDHARILGHASRRLLEVIICLENTGCRPGELLMATAADWNDRLGALVYYAEARRQDGEGRHKTCRKGKDRRIIFRGEALAVMRKKVQDHPTGPLWTTTRGARPLTVGALNKGFRKLRKQLGMPRLTPYSYRHTYATRWLESGRSIDDLAAMLGNTAAVIRKHYAHLCDNLERMQSLAEEFTSARTETRPRVLPFGEAAG